MHIVEVTRNSETLYVESLTATTVTFTRNWRKAERFPASSLPGREEIESASVKLVGYEAV